MDGSDHSSDIETVTQFTVFLHGQPVEIPLYHEHATISDLSEAVASDLEIPHANQKFLVTPKLGLLKPPFKDPTLLLSTLEDKKVVLMGATIAEIAELEDGLAARQARQQRRREALRVGRNIKANKHIDARKIQDEARYTFHTIKPLPYLPDPAKSQRFLERLRDDAGVKASMRRHGFSVGLLTEMDPAAHTTHESRTLGLNRNRGEVIELRLRTDAYDGYRDYKVIRKTLCHELAHNVWGDHDRNFWNLCREIEDEVEKNDWRRGGHALGADEFYNPNDEAPDENADEGGWTGGEYVLGGAAMGDSSAETLSRREIMARAAEKRIQRINDANAANEQRERKPST